MRKFLIIFSLIFITIFSTCTYATDISSEIPEMRIEEFVLMMQARQAKVDIIKKNNIEITRLKEELKSNIIVAADKVNTLKINIYSNNNTISDETINELKVLLEFLQQSTKTLDEDVLKISKEIEDILDLIKSRGMELGQYDLLIEKQNAVIVSMRNILQMVNQI